MLVKVLTKLESLEIQFNNHLSHHFKITLFLLSITGSVVIALLVLLSK